VLLGLASAPTAHGSVPALAPASTVAATPGYSPPPISWKRCRDATLRQFKARCGFLVVPLDYSHPHGRKIEIAVSRVLHTSPASKYQGVMLVNPGGPGGSGLIYSIFSAFVPHGAGSTYDWIGFDPRGVGSSKPSLGCDGRYFRPDRPDYVPRTRHVMSVWLKRSRHYASACAHAPASRLLGHVKTRDSAADMESLRKALGQQKINYYGFSYGTYLGSVYATLYPNRVRRFVLDSTVDPRGVWYRDNLAQDIAFERTVRIYFRWIAKYHAVYHLGRTGRAVMRGYYRQRHLLAKHPAGGVVGPDELTDVFLSPAYFVYGWEDVAQAYSAWVNHHNYKPLVRLARSADPVGHKADNGYAMYLGTECTDNQWPKNWARWKRDNRRIYRHHRFATWYNAWFNAPCAFWPAKAGHRVHVNGSKVRSPILMIDETFDPATPYEGSLEVRSRFPTASLIEGVNGTTHAGSLSGVACVDNAVARYLAHGTVPPRQSGRGADKRCPRVPRPHPKPAPSGAARHATTSNWLHEYLLSQLIHR
jgi:pimeloyl-ACP methyl ester carboxylesterase